MALVTRILQILQCLVNGRFTKVACKMTKIRYTAKHCVVTYLFLEDNTKISACKTYFENK